MTALDRLRDICTALPEVDERLNHGEPSWTVRRRAFATYTERFHQRPDLWCPAPPGAREALLATERDRYFEPRFGGRAWIGIRLDGDPDWQQVTEHVHEAYLLVAPQRLAAELPPLRPRAR
ncbi:MmcQ/YjbR family DNA-binding protein [Pseudonocardia sp. CA-107938]|uniref:MmcQ/YjbR family DNA-binding protein n=1 Tax=Pseudonocardia sp. CA-107938 TaxID=3240021 RepID=UPI003D932A76